MPPNRGRCAPRELALHVSGECATVSSANEPTPARVVRGRRRMRGRLRLLYSVCLSTIFPPGLDKCHPLWYNANRLYGMVTPSSAILAHAASICSGRASAVAQEQSSTTLVRWAFFVSSCKPALRSSRLPACPARAAPARSGSERSDKRFSTSVPYT